MVEDAAIRPIEPGDTPGLLGFSTADGSPIEMGEGCLIGQPLVLWIEGVLSVPMSGRDHAEKINQFRSVGAVFLVVAAHPPRANPASSQELAVHTVIDPDGTLARTVGLSGPGIVVFDADARLVSVRGGPAFDEALKQCTRIFHRSDKKVVGGTAPALVLHDVIEAPLCRRLIEYWHATDDKDVDTVANYSRGLGQKSTRGSKRRADVWITDPQLTAITEDRIRRRVFPPMRKAFQFEAAEFERLRVGCYDSANLGWFARHRDNAYGSPRNNADPTAYRQFAITINLNTHEYEGGELWFPEFGRCLYRPDAGGAVVFSVSLLHEALPVVSGRRFGIFGFVVDAANAELQHQAQADYPAKRPGRR